jgi:hypothetical protein
MWEPSGRQTGTLPSTFVETAAFINIINYKYVIRCNIERAASRRLGRYDGDGRRLTTAATDRRPTDPALDAPKPTASTRPPANPDAMTEVEADGVTARYRETDAERVLSFEYEGRSASVAINRGGYGMLKVRDASGDERERYYGFDMALDHAAELLGVPARDLPVPEDAGDMGM